MTRFSMASHHSISPSFGPSLVSHPSASPELVSIIRYLGDDAATSPSRAHDAPCCCCYCFPSLSSSSPRIGWYVRTSTELHSRRLGFQSCREILFSLLSTAKKGTKWQEGRRAQKSTTPRWRCAFLAECDSTISDLEHSTCKASLVPAMHAKTSKALFSTGKVKT